MISASAGRIVPRTRIRGIFRQIPGEAAIGGTICVAVLAVAIIGPLVAPFGPTEIVAGPFAPAAERAPFGTDFLGRDVLSRALHGGRSLIVLAVVATFVAYGAGAVIGLMAGFARSAVDTALMRMMDVLLGFPQLLFLLVVATGVGRSKLALVLAIAIVQLPSIARVVRGATLEQVGHPFVEAAIARGETTGAILRREIVPNISLTLLADAGLRLTWSLLLVAAVSFLGLGDAPPTANWALMIAENRTGLTFQPWAVVVPAVMIVLLTIGVNLVADGVARRFARQEAEA